LLVLLEEICMQDMFALRLTFLYGGVEFLANLIVLESKGINMILGMDSLSKHNGVIDSAKKAVRLTPSSGKELEYVAENLVKDKAAFNRIVLNHLDAASTLDIRIVSEFLDVSTEKLPGMPSVTKLSLLLN
jgi:hypothetical protein